MLLLYCWSTSSLRSATLDLKTYSSNRFTSSSNSPAAKETRCRLRFLPLSTEDPTPEAIMLPTECTTVEVVSFTGTAIEGGSSQQWKRIPLLVRGPFLALVASCDCCYGFYSHHTDTSRMTTFPHGGRVSPHEHLGGGQDQPFSSRQRRPGGEVNEVIDLSTTSSPQHSCPTATTAFALFAGAKLSDFTIGDRLGATRDGGEGFQVHCLLWTILVCFTVFEELFDV